MRAPDKRVILALRARDCYLCCMAQDQNTQAMQALPRIPVAPLALGAAILAAGVAGVYAYGGQGASLFVAMIETGIAWCF